MTGAQIAFLRTLAEHRGVFASYKSESEWTMPNNTVMQISRAEVEELEKLRLVSGSPEWWVARITEAGRAALSKASERS